LDKPDITVVICTFNRAHVARLALESLVAQETRDRFDYEVVVVDDASTDDTPDMVQTFTGGTAPEVRYVRAHGEGVAVARNRGIEEARGTWVAFTDDDQVNDPHWLVELYETAMEQDARVVGGGVELRLETEPAFPLTDVTSAILGQKRNPEGRIGRLMDCPGTGNVMFRRDVFDEVGKFDPELVWGGEDADLMLRIMQADIPVWFNPRSIVHHLIPPSRVQESYFRWASLRVGIALAEVDCRLRGKGKLAMLCVARVGQALLKNGPLYLLSQATGRKGDAVERMCTLWRAYAYTRETLLLLAPGVFPQRRFFEGLTFRAERGDKQKTASGA
jgi:GT2 family glycosyltransferase